VLLGDIKLHVGGLELGTDFGWVPLLDFVVCLKQIAVELCSSPSIEAVFDFTESDALIRFRRQGRDVEISASYNLAKGSVSLDEFVFAVEEFIEGFQATIVSRFPSLKANKAFKSLMAAA
jgi:hypothetical protein